MSAAQPTSQNPGETETLPYSAHILIVNDDPIEREVLVRKLGSNGYRCDLCSEGRIALEMLERTNYDVVLCDLTLADMDGPELLRYALKIRRDAAVILITAVNDVAVVVASIKEGACDYIVKPYSLEEVSAGVCRALEKRRLILENRDYERTLEEQVIERTQELKQALDVLEQTYRSTLVALSKALDSREPDSFGHSLRVTLLSIRLARGLGLGEPEVREIEQGALLHDIGKIGVPDELLRKKAPLTDAEWALMRRHPETGFRILSGIKSLQGAAQIVLQHQEWYNGQGYPAGLQGNEILLGARILSVAAAFDEMTSGDTSGPGISLESARGRIGQLAGTKLDPDVVKVFLSFPLKTWRELREEVAKSEIEKARQKQ